MNFTDKSKGKTKMKQYKKNWIVRDGDIEMAAFVAKTDATEFAQMKNWAVSYGPGNYDEPDYTDVNNEIRVIDQNNAGFPVNAPWEDDLSHDDEGCA